MSTTDLSHPTPGQLIAFRLGKLPETEASAIQSHLEACSRCRAIHWGDSGNTPLGQGVSGTLENAKSPRLSPNVDSPTKPIEVLPLVSGPKISNKTRSRPSKIRGKGSKKEKRSVANEASRFIRRNKLFLIPSAVVLFLGLILIVLLNLFKKDNNASVTTGDTKGSSGRAVERLPVTKITKHFIFPGHVAPVKCMAFSPDGLRFASGDEAGEILLRDLVESNKPLELKGHTQAVRSLTFSHPSGAGLLSGSDDKSMAVWDGKTGKLEKRFMQQDAVLSVAFSKNGLAAFSASKDGLFQVWNLSEKKVQSGHRENWQMATCLTLSADGRMVAYSDSNGKITIWDSHSPGASQFLPGNYRNVLCLCFSPDGRFLLSGGTDRTVRLWELSSKTLLQTFSAHSGPINGLAFSPTSRQILSGSDDKTIRLWDASTGNQLVIFEGHQDVVTTLAFSPDGSQILSGGNDKTVRLWDLP
ncbi:MAG TPA: zf-HC2 domain-containing protein [Gemmataceae bacterium]|nr:zf-HC2 domain-containing protein [Gemmataceae bacterium]